MSDFLNHAITVRDVLYLFIGAIGFVVVVGCAGALYLHWLDKKRAAFNRKTGEEHAAYNLRNPAYGAPKDGIKWQDGTPYTTDQPR